MAKQSKPWFRASVGAWYVWHGGKQVFLSRDERDAWKQFHLLMSREGRAVRRDLTVFDAAELFLDHSKAIHSPGTHTAYRGQLQPVVDGLGKIRLSELTAPRIERWLATRSHRAPDTRRNYVEALRAAIRYCKRAKLYDGPDPTDGAKVPPSGRRERVLSDAERQALWQVAGDALRDLLLVLSATGCRPHIAGALRASDIDFAAGVAVVQSKGRPYTVHFPAVVLARLREFAEIRPDGPLLLSQRGRRWTRDNMADAFKAACKRAKIAHASPYTMRHSMITDALASGMDVAIVGALVNHVDLNMIGRVYSKLSKRRDVMVAAAEEAAKAVMIRDEPLGCVCRSILLPGALRRFRSNATPIWRETHHPRPKVRAGCPASAHQVLNSRVCGMLAHRRGKVIRRCRRGGQQRRLAALRAARQPQRLPIRSA